MVAAMSTTPDNVTGNRNARVSLLTLAPPVGSGLDLQRADPLNKGRLKVRPAVHSLPDRADQVTRTIAYRERLSTDKYETPNIGESLDGFVTNSIAFQFTPNGEYRQAAAQAAVRNHACSEACA